MRIPSRLHPNETIGYSIRPSRYSFDVMEVKSRPESSSATQNTYETPIGYFRTMQHAAEFIFNKALRHEAHVQLKLSPSLNAVQALNDSISKALEQVTATVNDFYSQYGEVSRSASDEMA